MPPGKSVLLVDDSQTFRVMMERELRRSHESTQVFAMATGEDAILHLRLCGTSRPMPSIVLLDRTMPGGGMDGFATLELIRSEDHLQELPVIMVTGSDLEEHIERARQAGADEYLIKGGGMDSLARIAQRVLEWRPEESWRTSGDRMAGQSLVVRETHVPSSAMNGAASAIEVSPSHDENGFMRAFHAVRDFVVKSMDPVDFAISELCRKHHIPVAHARGRQQDQITVRNRRAVIFEFWDMGFSDPTTLENFQLSQRAVERLRAEWRLKRGGGLADRQF